MELEGETPTYIQSLIKKIQTTPFEKIKDYDLRKMGLEPSQIRRWFQANHKITFHAYQRLVRINSAFLQIQNGKSVTDSAFESGFDSLSGFNDGYKAIFGEPPSKSKEKTVIYIERFPTRLGPMYVCATEKGICLLEFTDRRMLEREFKDLRRRLNAVIVPGTNEHIRKTKSEILEYFEGRRENFTVSLDAPGTEFQKKVWSELQKIPYGKTRSYAEQARRLGCPQSVRAVANANGMNRIGIIIPCHRVIGSNGDLTGYAGGLVRKKWLLDLEAKN